MLLSEHQLTYGYWPSRQLSGQNPDPIRHPDEYEGSDTVNVSCTQTGLPARQQRNLVKAWCALLPLLPAKTVLFSSRVNQDLFDAAVANPRLEGLFIKWSSLGSLTSLAGHSALASMHLGGSPSATGLEVLSSLPALRHLFVDGVRKASDLGFVAKLDGLVEFGLSGGSTPLSVESLEPLAGLHSLVILWLVRVRPRRGGLQPLHCLTQLQSFRTSLNPDSKDLLELRTAIPRLQYLQPVR